MPNPYHDAEGKFCSKGEMQAAIQQAAVDNDLETYFRLRTDYDAIEKKTVTVTEEYLKKTVFSTDRYEFTDPEEIRTVYFKTTDVETHNYHNRARFYVNLLANPATPDDVKQDLLITNSDSERNRIILDQIDSDRSYRRENNVLPQDIHTLFDNETDPEILDRNIGSEALTFEQKYEFAQRTPSGLALLANAYPDEVFDKGEVEAKFTEAAAKAYQLEDSSANDRIKQRYFKAAAKASHSGPIAQALDNYNPVVLYQDKDGYVNIRYTPYHSFSKNPHLTPELDAKVLEGASKVDPTSYQEVLQNVIRKSVKSNAISMRQATDIYDTYQSSAIPPFPTHRSPESVEYAKKVREISELGSPRIMSDSAEQVAEVSRIVSTTTQDNWQLLSDIRKKLIRPSKKDPNFSIDGHTLRSVTNEMKVMVATVKAENAKEQFVKAVKANREELERARNGY